MIPTTIEQHLRQHHRGYQHHHHPAVMSAQELAQAEHVKGRRVAKPVALTVGGRRALAVVSAADRVRLAVLEEAVGAPVDLASEHEMATWFSSCQVGAEPPLAIFGLPIFVDARLLRERQLVMPAGTYEDSVLVDTEEWAHCENVQEIPNLGTAQA